MSNKVLTYGEITTIAVRALAAPLYLPIYIWGNASEDYLAVRSLKTLVAFLVGWPVMIAAWAISAVIMAIGLVVAAVVLAVLFTLPLILPVFFPMSVWKVSTDKPLAIKCLKAFAAFMLSWPAMVLVWVMLAVFIVGTVSIGMIFDNFLQWFPQFERHVPEIHKENYNKAHIRSEYAELGNRVKTAFSLVLAGGASLALLYQSMVVAGVLASTFIFPAWAVVVLAIVTTWYVAGVLFRLTADIKSSVFDYTAIGFLAAGAIAADGLAAAGVFGIAVTLFPPLAIGVLAGIAALAFVGAIVGAVRYFVDGDLTLKASEEALEEAPEGNAGDDYQSADPLTVAGTGEGSPFYSGSDVGEEKDEDEEKDDDDNEDDEFGLLPMTQ